MVKSFFQARQNICVKPCVVELALREWDEIAPLVTQAEHIRDQCFTVVEIAIAVEQQVAQCGILILHPRHRAEAGCAARLRDGEVRRRWWA